MLYPRTVNLNSKDVLVDDSQMRGYKEHMTHNHRTLFFSGVINSDTAESRHLFLALDSISHDPIKIFITSPGGDLDATFLIYDTFKFLKSPIITIGEYCASGAAILLAAGDKRYLYPHCKVMLHLPSEQMGSDARDWEIQHKQMQGYKNKMVDVLRGCGAKKNRNEILADIDRDYWLDSTEAIQYGLADGIMNSKIWGELCQ